MKVQHKPINVERHGSLKSIECGIAANRHSFDLLARQYSDPIKAILQELGANASESHTRAGTPEIPFKVQLPGLLDNHFRIRDYGVSMSPEIVEDVYVNYMNSDKRETNDEGGMFGIGSKTPFAYENLDSFNITTYLDGIVRLYTMAYNERGIPQLDQYGEADTDEPNGVEVSFAVNKDDFNVFIDKAKHVFSFFKTSPIVCGVKDFALKTYPKKYEGSNWSIVEKTGSSYVIMGDIGYPIDCSHFDWSSGAKKLFGNHGVHFTVDMASIDIVPSREGLEYTQKTKEILIAHAEKIINEIDIMVSKSLSKAHSQWHANVLLEEAKRDFNRLGLTYGSCKYKVGNRIDLQGKEVLASYSYAYNGKAIGSFARPTKKFSCGSGYKIIIKDTDKACDKKCRAFIVKNNCGIVLIGNAESKKDIMDYVGAIDKDSAVILASELPDTPKVKRVAGTYTRKKTRRVLKFHPKKDAPYQYGYGSSDKRYWSDYEIDPKQGDYIYVNLNRYNIEGIQNVYCFLETVSYVGIVLPEIVGLRSVSSKLGERTNFTSLSDWIKQELAKIEAAGSIISDCINKETIREISNKSGIDIAALKFLAKELAPNPLLNNDPLVKLLGFVKIVKHSEKEGRKISAFLTLSKIVGYNCKQKGLIKADSKIVGLVKLAMEKYPLFFCVAEDHYGDWFGKHKAIVSQMFSLIK